MTTRQAAVGALAGLVLLLTGLLLGAYLLAGALGLAGALAVSGALVLLGSLLAPERPTTTSPPGRDDR